MAGWLVLFEAAVEVIDEAERLLGAKIDWTVGGGTMLFRRYKHRHSKDIDIFLTDPQLLPSLSPRLNDVAARYVESGHAPYVEQSNFLKLALHDGEIDFIVAPRLTAPHAEPGSVGRHAAMIETPSEILAKKVFYRAADFTARDVFDLAFLVENGEAEKLMADAKMFLPKLRTILDRMETKSENLKLSFAAIQAEDYNPNFEHCAAVIRAFVQRHQRS